MDSYCFLFGDFRDEIVKHTVYYYPYSNPLRLGERFSSIDEARKFEIGFMVNMLRHLQEGSFRDLKEVFECYDASGIGPKIASDEWTVCISRHDMIKNGNERQTGFGPGLAGLGVHLHTQTTPYTLCDPDSPPAATVAVFRAPIVRQASVDGPELAAFLAIARGIVDFIKSTDRKIGTDYNAPARNTGDGVAQSTASNTSSDPSTWVACSACQST